MSLTTKFLYNLPVENHVTGKPDELILVTAMLLDNGFVFVSASERENVMNEEMMTRDLIQIARQRFEEKQQHILNGELILSSIYGNPEPPNWLNHVISIILILLIGLTIGL